MLSESFALGMLVGSLVASFILSVGWYLDQNRDPG